MAIEIRVPTLGELITEATVGKWFKKAGEPVQADEPLVELETDKVTLEVNAPSPGVLSEIVAETGQTVAIGALLGQVAAGAATPAAPAPARRQSLRRSCDAVVFARRQNCDAACASRGQDRRRGQDRSGLDRRQRQARSGAERRRACRCCGGPGASLKDEAKRGRTKPIVGFIAGRTAPSGRRWGRRRDHCWRQGGRGG